MTITPFTDPSGRRMYLCTFKYGNRAGSVVGWTHMYAFTNALKVLTEF